MYNVQAFSRITFNISSFFSDETCGENVRRIKITILLLSPLLLRLLFSFETSKIVNHVTNIIRMYNFGGNFDFRDDALSIADVVCIVFLDGCDTNNLIFLEILFRNWRNDEVMNVGVIVATSSLSCFGFFLYDKYENTEAWNKSTSLHSDVHDANGDDLFHVLLFSISLKKTLIFCNGALFSWLTFFSGCLEMDIIGGLHVIARQ